MEQGLWQLICEMKCRYENQSAFLYLEGENIRAVSYEDFMWDVLSRTAACSALPQKRIGLWGYNSYTWIVWATGVLLSGKEAILLDANLDSPDLLRLAEYTEVELLLADRELLDENRELLEKISVRTFEAAEKKLQETKNTPSAGWSRTWENGLSPKWAEVPDLAPHKEGHFICFTSGTSKSAKGAVITTKALHTAVETAEGILPGRAGERYYLPLPFHHIYAFTELFHVLKRGGTVCVGRGGRYLWEDMELFSPGIAFFVPSMVRYLLNGQALPPSLHSVLSGGSSLKEDLAGQMEKCGLEFFNLYGLSETLGMICCSTEEKGLLWLKPFPGIRFVLSKEQEVGVYLPFHMLEYYKREQETLQVLDSEAQLFWTGDAGEMDEDGCVRIRGRLRDTIVLENGEKLHAEDVDGELSGLLGPRGPEAAVIGLGGRLEAVFAAETEVLERAAREAVEQYNKKKPAYMRITRVWCRKKGLPRTVTGKLRRFQLENEYRNEGKYDTGADY